MSTARRKSASFVGKGPNGRNLCFCGCGREVQKPRLNWFSDECVKSWKLINDPATIRSAVLARDGGICGGCGKDCDRDARIARETRNLWLWLARREAERLFELGQLPEPWKGSGQHWGNGWHMAVKWVDEDMRRFFPGWDRGHTWEADHIVPVIEGGGQCGLENYRTLCLACHKKATAALAARRAQARRTAVQPELQIQ